LTNSKVPRDTKKLVAGVGEKKHQVDLIPYYLLTKIFIMDHQEPELMKGLLDSIQSISDEARRCLADPELSREQLLSAISVRKPTFPLTSHNAN
jgi:hypothetical protein